MGVSPKKPGLVLARKTGEEVLVDDSIVVTVVDIRGGQVKLHFSAPGHVAISRGEFGVESHMGVVNRKRAQTR